MYIRPAKPNEAVILTDLAVISEAYWGYNSDYMEKFKTVYKVTELFIKNNPTYIIKDNNKILGFYGMLMDTEEISLEYLFIEPESIGKGYGRALWNHMSEKCKELGIKEISIVTSPEAKEFYIKMGAKHVTDVESLLKRGRIIPKFIYKIK